MVLAAAITQQVHLKSDNVQLERAAQVAEERSAGVQQQLMLAEAAFEKKSFEAQQEYEENVTGLMQTIASQDAQLLARPQPAEPQPATDSDSAEVRFNPVLIRFNPIKFDIFVKTGPTSS